MKKNLFKDQGYLKLTMTSACDMALQWKGLAIDGGLGYSGVSYPCECCPLTPRDFTVPNPPSGIHSCKQCRIWKILGKWHNGKPQL